MTAVCRIGDTCTGTCTAHSRTFIGTWQTGSDILTADGIGVVRVGDTGITDCPVPHTCIATGGSDTTTVSGTGVHRVSDGVTLDTGGTGVSISGSPYSDFG